MAIEKTYIYDENSDTALAKISEFLTTAVPNYFSKVENENGIVSCYADNDLLMMTIEYPMNTKGLTIYTKNGTSVNINTGNNSYPKIGYGYTLKNGISLQIVASSAGAIFPFALAITKDEEENTVIIAENRLVPSISANTVIPIYIINLNSDEIEYLKMIRYSSSNFKKTVLVPFVVLGSKGNYTPNAFLQLFNHNNEQGTLEIDGVKYFSNGLWCIKDE